MNKPGVLLFLFLITGHLAKSTTWATTGNGYWPIGSIWSNGVAPPYSSSDTIIIRDTIFFTDDIFLNSGAFMLVDTGGALCGHHNITVYTGARLNSNGAITLDTLFVTGGQALCTMGCDIWMQYGIVSVTGASFDVHSGGQVHAWDGAGCFSTGVEELSPVGTLRNSFLLFQNPDGNLSLQYRQLTESTFYFYNVMGQKIFSSSLEGTEGVKSFYQENLPPGIYCWRVVAGSKVYGGGKVVIGR